MKNPGTSLSKSKFKRLAIQKGWKRIDTYQGKKGIQPAWIHEDTTEGEWLTTEELEERFELDANRDTR